MWTGLFVAHATEGIIGLGAVASATVWASAALAAGVCVAPTWAARPVGLWVQFSPDAGARADAELSRLATHGHQWKRALEGLSDQKLCQMQQCAQMDLGVAIDDPRMTFLISSPDDVSALAAVEDLRTNPVVAWVEPAYGPVEPPSVAPDFETQQHYRVAAPVGIGATNLSGVLSPAGAGVTIADVEYSWNLAHSDLPPVTRIGPAPVDPFNNDSHGTAVLGVLGARQDDVGVIGIAPSATLRVVAANTSAGYNLASAIANATAALRPGDVLLIQQQIVGPAYTGVPAGTQVGLVPVEWQRAAYNAIVTAVGNGITVVVAAGNGSQNLDGSIYNVAPAGHRPFRPEGDSGSILVGAGAANPGSTTPRSRLSFSNHGAAVDLQGWGEGVWSTGFGDAYNAAGRNLYFTSSFLGTSSGAAIVAGAAALLQSAYRGETGLTLPPRDVREALVATGSPQTSGAFPATQNIGPLPDVRAALQYSLARAPLPPGPFAMSSPAQGESVQTPTLVLTWESSLRATSYLVEVDSDASFVSPEFAATVTSTALPIPPGTLPLWRTYTWRVTALNGFGSRIAESAGSSFTLSVDGCPADSNGDGLVGFLDIAHVLTHWGSPGPDGDNDRNGVVNMSDVIAILLFWGSRC